MATMIHDVLIEADAAHVWAAIRDVGAVHRRLVPGYVVDARVDGNQRTLTMASGDTVRELIVTIDDATRRLAYGVVEGRMPLVFHHAALQVSAEDGDRSRLVWITDLLPNELAPEIQVRVERGAQVMKETLERSFRDA